MTLSSIVLIHFENLRIDQNITQTWFGFCTFFKEVFSNRNLWFTNAKKWKVVNSLWKMELTIFGEWNGCYSSYPYRIFPCIIFTWKIQIYIISIRIRLLITIFSLLFVCVHDRRRILQWIHGSFLSKNKTLCTSSPCN